MTSLSNRFGGCCLLAALLLSPTLPADTAHVAEDAHIDLGNPEDNNGVVPNLVVSNIVEKKTGERLTFVSYELPALPAGASLEQALLRLFVGKVATPGDIDLYLVTEAWDEHGLSGMTAPDFEAVPFATFSVSAGDEGHFFTVDVTPEVQDWLNGAEPNHGFVLMANPVTDVDVSFDSKENGQTSHQSELELVLGTATGGVDSDDIADNSVGTEDIEDNSVTSVDIADGSIGQSDVDKNAVQLRITGTCAAGSSIREVDNMGGVTCEPDDDSGGDITSVFPEAGGGLQGGADSGDALLGIAPEGVDSAMIADGTIVAADVEETSVQLRVGGSCPAGQSIRAISTTGGVTCEVDDDSDTTLDPDLFWQVDGNAGTSPIPGGSNFLGTTDDTELALGVNSAQALRLSHVDDGMFQSVNIVGGHASNQVTATGGVIGGGGYYDVDDGTSSPNQVTGRFGTIGGGFDNSVLDFGGFVGGGAGNTIEKGSGYSVIAGGRNNSIETDPRPGINSRGFIGGGQGNRIIHAFYSTIAGGDHNNVHFAREAFIGGGDNNSVCDPDVFEEELEQSDAGLGDVIGGGRLNRSCGFLNFIGSGQGNQASGRYSAIVGGEENTAQGIHSTVLGGFRSQALADYSMAAGFLANAIHPGSLVWNTDPDSAAFSQRDYQARFRAIGGVRFDVGDDAGTASHDHWVDIRTQALNTLGNNPGDFRLIDTSTGAYLSLGGGWVTSSDRNRKTDIRDVDANWILEQIAAMPIQSWRYKVEGEDIRHIGPMAQDFHAAFGFGGDPKGIMSVDADGVALAAIQALYRVTRELDARTRQLEEQQQRLDTLEASLQALEARFDPIKDRRLVRAQVHLDSD